MLSADRETMRADASGSLGIIRGFVFERQEKAYGRLYGGEADQIYGDSFLRDGNIVRRIGNNVTIGFYNMDFGEEGAARVTICGSTPLAVNTIHIRFTEESGETVKQTAEFPGTGPELKPCSFPVAGLRGKGRIELIFLPGSSFDLEYVQFEK